MKKSILFLLAIIFTSSYAGKYVSQIPLPTTYLVDISPQDCNQSCLVENFNNGNIFSFLSKFKNENSSLEISSFYNKYKSLLHVKDIDYKLKLAILIPKQVIGRYSSSVTNSIISYLILRNSNFEVKVFNSVNENSINIEEQIRNIEKEGFTTVISVLTKNGLIALENIDTKLRFSVPTINKKNIKTNKDIIFAGIDYNTQIKELVKLSNKKLSLFYDDSIISKTLAQDVAKEARAIGKRVNSNEIKPKETKFKKILRGKYLSDSTVFLNIPIVKSSLLLSSITHYNKTIDNILSTQINYNPLILELTQIKDRQEMYIANSIIKRDKVLEEYSKMLNVDIQYDWINYTSSVVVDYIFSKDNNTYRTYDINIQDNQFIYDINVTKIDKYKL
jgi:SRSO17 transposase